MAAKQKPCTLGSKHKWIWVRNITISTIKYTPRGTTGHHSLRGEYKCECGEIRIGQSNPNGEDLRSLL